MTVNAPAALTVIDAVVAPVLHLYVAAGAVVLAVKANVGTAQLSTSAPAIATVNGTPLPVGPSSRQLVLSKSGNTLYVPFTSNAGAASEGGVIAASGVVIE